MIANPLYDRLRLLLAGVAGPVYLVGGVVRDTLLGRAVHDIDLVVARDAIPLTFWLADRLGLPAYSLDAERDVGRIVVPGSPTTLDIARFRGATLADDLRGRDFTINALALPAAATSLAEVIDHHDGRRDLDGRRVRIIHADSIADDPVRALRAVRFAVSLDFAMTPETETAVRAAGSSLTARISPERIRDELHRLLATDDPGRGVVRLRELGLLEVVLPEVAATDGVAQSPPHFEDVFDHTCSVLRHLIAVEAAIIEPDGDVSELLAPYRDSLIAHLERTYDGGFGGRFLLRWGALLHDIGKPPTRTTDETGRIRFFDHDEVGARLAVTRLNRLAFSGEAVRHVRDIVAGHMRPFHLAAGDHLPSRRAIYRYYRALYAAGVDAALLSLADHLATYGGVGEGEKWQRLRDVVGRLLETYFTAYTATVAPVRLLNGQEVMALLGIEPGRELGRILSVLEEAQAAGEVTTQEEAIEFVKRAAG